MKLQPTVSASLRDRRRALGMTQAALAKELGVAPMSISRWEIGSMGVARPLWLLAMLELIALRQQQDRASVDVTTAGEI